MGSARLSPDKIHMPILHDAVVAVVGVEWLDGSPTTHPPTAFLLTAPIAFLTPKNCLCCMGLADGRRGYRFFVGVRLPLANCYYPWIVIYAVAANHHLTGKLPLPLDAGTRPGIPRKKQQPLSGWCMDWRSFLNKIPACRYAFPIYYEEGNGLLWPGLHFIWASALGAASPYVPHSNLSVP